MKRFRHFRTDDETRRRHAEVSLRTRDFILPYFVVEGNAIKKEIPSLPGHYHFSIDTLLEDLGTAAAAGIDKILIFGVVDPARKDAMGTAAGQKDNLVARAVAAVKRAFPFLTVITDVCLCAYTTHGHCGVVDPQGQGPRRCAGAKNRRVLNDETLPLLARMALTHAMAGADFVAPSAMMDGQVGAIRRALDQHGLHKTKILSYSAKYASSFYGPFRDAAGSSPAFGDRKTYQMDYRTAQQAVDEVKADIEEGADWVMVKPAHTYLDIIHRIKEQCGPVPLAAFHVSGEHAMLKAAARAGLLDETQALREILTAIKRAGADYVITYGAKTIAAELNAAPARDVSRSNRRRGQENENKSKISAGV